MKKSRKYGLELLRIIAMFIIVFVHFSVHGSGFTDATSINNPLVLSERLLENSGFFAVNIFILITGFFMIDKQIDFSSVKAKILPLWRQTFGYSVAILIVMFIIAKPSLVMAIVSLFPVLLNRYWFITTYIILMLLTPIINRAFNNIDNGKYKKIVIVLVCVFSIWPTVIPIFQKVMIVWFVVLYIIGGYIKRVGINLVNNKLRIPLFFLMLGVYFVYSYVLDAISGKVPVKIIIPWHNSFFALVASITLFNFFYKINIKDGLGKVINWVSKSVIAIYIITEHPLIRKVLFTKIFDLKKNMNHGFTTVRNVFLFALITYFVCLFIDILRRLLVQLFVKIKK